MDGDIPSAYGTFDAEAAVATDDIRLTADEKWNFAAGRPEPAVEDLAAFYSPGSSCPACGGTPVLLPRRSLWLCPRCERVWGVGEAVGSPARALSVHAVQPLSIFLSYGHDRYQWLAIAIKERLRARGHSVWFDLDNLKPGGDWEADIAHGLNWAKAAQGNGRVLLMMTPHAVRRPDGYCLNEVARAVMLKIPMVPCMVADCEPPESIMHMPYLSLTDCFPTGVDEEEWKDACAPAFEREHVEQKLRVLCSLLEVGMHASLGSGFIVQPGSVRTGAVARQDKPGFRRLGSDPSALEESKDEGDSRSLRFVLLCDPSVVELAVALSRTLQEAGHRVYFNRDKLFVGEKEHFAWMNAGIKWAKEEPELAKVLLLMTPEAVSRPDGFCLIEVGLAINNGMDFVPAMVRWCEPPLSICRIQWLDLMDTLNADGSLNSVRYASRAERLLAAVDGGLDHEGNQSRLVLQLSPLSYDQELAAHDMMRGRDWLVSSLDTWMATDDAPRARWLTAGIGYGKSLITSWLCRNKAFVAAFHLADPDDDNKRSARKAVLSLAFQLSTQLAAYETRLAALQLEEIVPMSNPRQLFQRLIVQPLNLLAKPPPRKLFVVDALEAMNDGPSNEMASILASFNDMPSWCRLLILSREDAVLTSLLYPLAGEPLGEHAEENEADLRSCLEHELKPFFEDGSSDVPASIVEEVLQRAEGLFLYVRHVLQALSAGRLTLDKLEAFPVGLGGLFLQIFEKQFVEEEAYERCRPLLEVLCAELEPLPLETVWSMLDISAHDRQLALMSLGSLFSLSKGRLVPFHSSVKEWLLDGTRCSVRFLIDECGGHSTLANWCFSAYEAAGSARSMDSLPAYVIEHAERHMEAAKRVELLPKLSKMLRDEAFMTVCRVRAIKTDGMFSFYHGSISRGDTQRRLAGCKEGSFLIRFSERQKQYCVSFVDPTAPGSPPLRHNLLYQLPDNRGYSICPASKVVEGVTAIYKDLGDFVQAFQRKGVLKESVAPPS